MQDRKLITIAVVADDDTGIYGVGDMDYSMPYATKEWVATPENRKKLADWLDELARACRDAEPPFDLQSTGGEGRIRSSDYDKALIEELEGENERLRDEVNRQTKAKECYEERLARKEAENARLRKCVEVADVIRRPQFLSHDWRVKQRWHAALDAYDRVRAEVDK